MMTKSPFNPGRIAKMAAYVLGAWASLAALMLAGPWEPQDAIGQSGRIVLLLVAGVALLICVIAATAHLLSSSAASVPDPDPRP